MAARKKPAAKDEVSFIKRKRGSGPPRLRHIAASSASSELNSCSSPSSDDLRVWIAQRKIWLAFGRSSSPSVASTERPPCLKPKKRGPDQWAPLIS